MAELVQKDIDNTLTDPTRPAVLVTGEHDLASVTEVVSRISEAPRMPPIWYVALAISSTLTLVLLAMVTYLFVMGVGVWGVMIPTAWGFAIVNFVFWIGIGHAGTLISAILFLFRQKWRTGINRFAEAMTIFAVICAGMFPVLHLGRPWYAYWLFPYPNYMMVWPQFKSPLIWDVFAVSTYFTVSLLFWYMGMVPDLATLRDRAKSRVRHAVYGILSLGWRGSGRHWHRYEVAYLILAALATPLVLSVHSVVSFDFAVSQLPGWHTTIFPPYFVAGAIFSGFAMVLTLIIPARQYLGLKDIVTLRHVDNMAKVMLATGLMVDYSYGVEFWTSWYSGNIYEQFTTLNRAMGPFAWAFWIMMTCNIVVPHLLWFKRVRINLVVLWIVSLLINVGMWFERFVIIVTSLGRDFLPSSWGYYRPTWVDLLTLAGSFGLFLTLFLLFVRYLPVVAMAEVKSIMPQAHLEHGKRRGLGQYWGEIPHGQQRQGPRGGAAVSGSSVQPGASTQPQANTLHGLLAEYDGVVPLLAAAGSVRDAGYARWDTYTPIPIHGLDEAMGLRRTRLPWLVFAAGFSGALLALLMMWWMNDYNFVYVVSGKPPLGLPAFVPIMFEVTILLAAITAFVGMVISNRLPQLFHSFCVSRAFAGRVTTDRFFIGIEAADPRFDVTSTRRLLEESGAVRVETVEEEPPVPIPAAVRRFAVPVAVVLLAIAMVPPILIARSRVVPSGNPQAILIPDMWHQKKYITQSANPIFADNRAMRPLTPGTVAVGHAELDAVFYRGIEGGQWAKRLPVAVTSALLERGQERFDIYCAPCHGWDGAGQGLVSVRGQATSAGSWIVPANLEDALVRNRPDGHVFNTITNGIRTMPPYGMQIPTADRWAIISYVRALELSQAAPLDAVPAEQRRELR